MANKFCAIILFIILLPIFFIVILLIIFEDGLPVFFRQKRVGINNTFFIIYKFRSMKKGTPNIATHLLDNPDAYILRIGYILRKSSIDELPNLLNIVKGDMAFIGPRPALYNQFDLNALNQLMSSINWLYQFNNLNIDTNKVPYVIVSELLYFEFLNFCYFLLIKLHGVD